MQLKKRASTGLIVVHCAATPPTLDIGAKEIDQWHRARGWLCIGYHFVIRRNGAIEKGRDVDVVGAHVEGHNATSVGICLVGGVDAKNSPEANFTPAQKQTLITLLHDMLDKYPDAEIKGHRDLNSGKACPSFDVNRWIETGEMKTAK